MTSDIYLVPVAGSVVPRSIDAIAAVLGPDMRAAFMRDIGRADLLDPFAVRAVADRYRELIADAQPDRLSMIDRSSVAAFVTSMRELKEWSGASLRELEKRARAVGDYNLSSSSLSDALRSAQLPRPELLAAFTRACRLPPSARAAWLDALVSLSTEESL